MLSVPTVNKIAGLCERAATLLAAADFYRAAGEQIEQQARAVDDVREKFRLVALAQSKYNQAGTHKLAASEILANCRQVCNASGETLPGIDGVRAIADVYADLLGQSDPEEKALLSLKIDEEFAQMEREWEEGGCTAQMLRDVRIDSEYDTMGETE